MLSIEENRFEQVIGMQGQHDYRDVIAPHTHLRAQLLYPTEGTLRVHTAKHVWIVSPHSALWIPAGVEHSAVALSQVKLSTALVDPDSAYALGPDCILIKMTDLLTALIIRINQMQSSGFDNRNYALELIKSIQFLILDEIHQALSLPVELPWPTDSRLVGICEALLSQPQQRKDLTVWADHIGTSPRTLMRLFQKQTGLTYRAWIQHMHIALALAKLARGESVARLATALGYTSPSAFSAMFKRHMGQTPQQFRR
ncbi:AraC-like DNA-binding protein [Acinetobacter calcoaceticus]|uniref:AraC-like DNA-binding protein n=1 Tax=Acinetobacter calcoaceticus TaxID=471 RepID=A0A4R1Y2F7_ACICA|nr:AraC-like DNA-binding protein [Acinetobacter calcoaceticus]